MTQTIYKKDLLFPELSYKIVGCAYEVFNEIGGGHKEVIYQKALGISFTNHKLAFKEQVYYPITFKDVILKRNFFDFLVDEKIVVEIKSLAHFTKGHYDQTLKYLNVSGIKLALLITFGQGDVRVKRVVNFPKVTGEPFANS
jgi:GxxExxY protein